ncbi:unnamed protein product [Closterium sp. NIES-65]|nr:unnamed protein product [Closterium sp. NIES-65]
MHSRLLVSGLPRSLPSLSRSPMLPCLPCVEGRQRATPHSFEFPPTTAPLQTLHMDVWGLAPVGGTDQERYFLLIVGDYTRYTTVFPLRRKADVSGVLIPSIRATRRQLHERFRRDFPVLRLHSDRGKTSPTLRWTGKVSNLSVFRVRGALSLVHDAKASKLSFRTLCYNFLGFPTDAPPWQFYYPRDRRVFSSQDITFDEGADSGGAASTCGGGAVGDPAGGTAGAGGAGGTAGGAGCAAGTGGTTGGAGGAAGTGGTRGAAGAGGAGAASPGGTGGAAGAGAGAGGAGAAGAGGAEGAGGTAGARGAGAGGFGGAGAAGLGGARTGGTGAARAGGAAGARGARSSGGAGAGGTRGARATGAGGAAGAGGAGGATGAAGTGVGGTAGAIGAGAAGARGAAGAGGSRAAGAGGVGGAGADGSAPRRLFFYPKPQLSMPPPDSPSS